MGSIAHESHITVLLADYIGIDAGGKVNALGAGFTMVPLVPTGLTAQQGPSGVTSPMHVAVLIDVPAKHAGQQFALSLELRDEVTNSVVLLPGPSGVPEPLRVQQMVRADRPQVQGLYISPDMFCRVQISLAFPTGLPLSGGGFYSWRAEIDGQHRKGWRAQFHVPGPPPPPVFGGPAGPANIPTLPPSASPGEIAEDDDEAPSN